MPDYKTLQPKFRAGFFMMLPNLTIGALITVQKGRPMKTADVECFECFQWAVPNAFSDSLSQCRFERGDILYSNPGGYEQWDKALKRLGFTVQVKSPASTARTVSEEGVFEDNWKSPVVFTLIDHALNITEEITTTQGSLYMLLWKGVRNFDSCTPPPLPLTCMSIAKKAESAVYEVKKRFSKMEKPNVWLMGYDPTSSIAHVKYVEVKKRLEKEFSVSERFFTVEEVGLKGVLCVPTLKFVAFAIDLGASARIADALKEVLYKPPKKKTAEESSDETTEATSPEKAPKKDRFRLSAHGAFLPSHTQNFGDLITISFKHVKGSSEVFYRYRLFKPRLESVPSELKDFLNSVTVDCPSHLFREPPYCSGLQFPLPIKLTRERTHHLTDLAGESFTDRKYKSAHENVQMFLIDKDPETIAAEIPVWVDYDELGDFAHYVQPAQCSLTGHIDLIRVHKGTVEIWDYKPGAFDEKFAATQVFFYALMLSKRTGIPLSKMKCGYFDPSDAFTFSPEEAAREIVASAVVPKSPPVSPLILNPVNSPTIAVQP